MENQEIKMTDLRWSFFQVWNESLEQREERPPKPRQNLWASELGKAPIDLWLKMRGTAPSNPFDARSLRKFEAGNIWEWIVGLVLKRAGIFLEDQGWVSYQYPNLLEVTGKLDFLAGGQPDWERARVGIKEIGLPEFLVKASDAIITHFEEKYPNGLQPIVLEIKSCSAFMYERYLTSGKAGENHRIQAFHYIKARDLPEAHIVYISKDDARMLELGVLNPSSVEDEYRAEISKLTHYFKSGQQPPKEKEIIFDEEFGKFSTNWKVRYSNYLTMLYGYKNQGEFEGRYKSQVARWNRVLGRCVRGDKRTAKNLEVLEEIRPLFPNFDELVIAAGRAGVGEEEEVGNEEH